MLSYHGGDMSRYNNIIYILLIFVLCSGCNMRERVNDKEPLVILNDRIESEDIKEGIKKEPILIEEENTIEYSHFKQIEEVGEKIFSIEEIEKIALLSFEEGKELQQVAYSIIPDDKATIKIVYKEVEYIINNANIVYLVDINKTDNFKEMIIEGMGPGGNTCNKIFRVLNDEIVMLGTVYDTIKMDGEGHILNSLATILFSPAPLIGMVYVIHENALVEEIVHKEQLTFSLDEEIQVDFTPEDLNEGIEGIQYFKKGTHFIIYEYVTDAVWRVEIDGVKGRMCLQIAG